MTSRQSQTPSPIEELTYEEAYSDLEELILALENEEHTLDEALALFERGQALANRCAGLLDEAELKLEQLSGETVEDLDLED